MKGIIGNGGNERAVGRSKLGISQFLDAAVVYRELVTYRDRSPASSTEMDCNSLRVVFIDRTM